MASNIRTNADLEDLKKEIKRIILVRATVLELHRVTMGTGMATLLQGEILKRSDRWTDYRQVTAVAK